MPFSQFIYAKLMFKCRFLKTLFTRCLFLSWVISKKINKNYILTTQISLKNSYL